MCANIEAQTIAGRKPLHFAAGFIGVSNEPAKTLEILIQNGASLKIRNNHGFAPFEYALQANTSNMEKLKCFKALCYKKMLKTSALKRSL